MNHPTLFRTEGDKSVLEWPSGLIEFVQNHDWRISAVEGGKVTQSVVHRGPSAELALQSAFEKTPGLSKWILGAPGQPSRQLVLARA